MKESLNRKLSARRGISRLMVIVLALVLAMLVVVMIPVVRHTRELSAEIGCLNALDTASRQIAVDYLAGNYDPTAQDIKDVVTYAMNGWDDLCPGGGNVYVVATPEGDLPFKLVCGIHATDLKERTRLNASYALRQLEDALRVERAMEREPESPILLRLNGKDLPAERLEEENSLRRGTDATIGMKGTVCFFTLDEEWNVTWFVYADEAHAAVWRPATDWTGDSYA